MASPVVTLNELARVGDVIDVLTACPHNGFPVVRLDLKPRHGGRFVCGLILRRQLLALLHERVWEPQKRHEQLPASTRERFLSSFNAQEQLELDSSRLELSPGDLDAIIDLRPFYDASPFTAYELMPLVRVFKLFNEMGVRTVPVLDRDMRLSGVITRKDLLSKTIISRLSVENYLKWLHRHQSGIHPRGRTSGIGGANDASQLGTKRRDASPESFAAAPSKGLAGPATTASPTITHLSNLTADRVAGASSPSAAKAESPSFVRDSPSFVRDARRTAGVPMRRRSSNASIEPSIEDLLNAERFNGDGSHHGGHALQNALHHAGGHSDESEDGNSTASRRHGSSFSERHGSSVGPPSMHLLRRVTTPPSSDHGESSPALVSRPNGAGSPYEGRSRIPSVCSVGSNDAHTKSDHMWGRIATRKSNVAMFELLTDRILDPTTGVPISHHSCHAPFGSAADASGPSKPRKGRRNSTPAVFANSSEMKDFARSRRSSARQLNDANASPASRRSSNDAARTSVPSRRASGMECHTERRGSNGSVTLERRASNGAHGERERRGSTASIPEGADDGQEEDEGEGPDAADNK